jgi:putative transposase
MFSTYSCWVHIRTSNPVELTFASVRAKTKKTQGCFNRTTILTMIFMLGLSAGKGFRKLREFWRLADIINGIKFMRICEGTIER